MRAIVVLALLLIVQPAFAGARENIHAASKGVETVLGEPLTPAGPFVDPGESDEKTFCYDDVTCQAEAAKYVFVQATGHSIRTTVSSRVDPDTYYRICLGILAGLTEDVLHPDYVTKTMEGLFQVAASSGRAHTRLGSVEVKVQPAGEFNLLECDFVRWQ